MIKFEILCVIYFLNARDEKRAELHRLISEAYEKGMARKCIKAFKDGHKNVHDKKWTAFCHCMGLSIQHLITSILFIKLGYPIWCCITTTCFCILKTSLWSTQK